jgi:predicted MFS family arabinose efflux permease
LTRLDRDRLTWLVYLQLGTYGYFLYGFGPTVPLLRDEQDVSRALAGLHGSALAVGALLAALVFADVIRRYGRGVAMWGGLVLLCVGVVTYTATTALPVTLLGSFVASFGGSFVVTTTSASLSDRHGARGPSAISEANAVAAGLGMVAPLVVGVAVGVGAGWRAALLVVVPWVALLALVGRRARVPGPPESPAHDGASRRLPVGYWIGWGVLTCGIAVEFCMVLWTADVLRDRFDLGAGAASAGVTAVVGGMCVGRLVGGRLALRVDVGRLLQGAITVCGAGFAVFWLTTWAPLALAGLVVCGLGISLFYPLGIARAIEASEGRPDLASGRAGLAAALASGGGPFVLGALADGVGIHGAFLVVPVLLLLAAAGVHLGSRRRVASAT